MGLPHQLPTVAAPEVGHRAGIPGSFRAGAAGSKDRPLVWSVLDLFILGHKGLLIVTGLIMLVATPYYIYIYEIFPKNIVGCWITNLTWYQLHWDFNRCTVGDTRNSFSRELHRWSPWGTWHPARLGPTGPQRCLDFACAVRGTQRAGQLGSFSGVQDICGW